MSSQDGDLLTDGSEVVGDVRDGTHGAAEGIFAVEGMGLHRLANLIAAVLLLGNMRSAEKQGRAGFEPPTVDRRDPMSSGRMCNSVTACGLVRMYNL